MRKLVIAALFALAWGLLASAPAGAAESHVPFCFDPVTGSRVLNCSFTANIHGLVATGPSQNPCSGVLGTQTTVTNEIIHITINGAGNAWITTTATAHFDFVPSLPGPPTYEGEFTFWFGASLNNQNSVSTDIFNAVVHGSDGSQITMHAVDHVSVSASGVVNEFHIVSATCP